MKHQLCPKCNGDGHLGRYNSPAVASTNSLPQCDVCFGAKTLIVRDGQPIVTDEQILRVLQNHQQPVSGRMIIDSDEFSSIVPRMRKLFQEEDNTKAELEKFFDWYKQSNFSSSGKTSDLIDTYLGTWIPTAVPRKSRCCGRCDGVNDICVGDTTCEPHNELGCEICYGPRN